MQRFNRSSLPYPLMSKISKDVEFESHMTMMTA